MIRQARSSGLWGIQVTLGVRRHMEIENAAGRLEMLSPAG